MIIIRNIQILGIFMIIGLFYFLFPTNNSGIDAYAYAAQVKYSKDLFQPHHLLHNPLNFFILEILSFLNIRIDPLLLGKVLNSLFAVSSGYVLYLILSFFNQGKTVNLLFVLIVCFSFNTWRFGTENEVYIEPVFFSLLGSYFFLKYIKSEHIKYVWLTGIFSATACLFHQIHFFWWFGLSIGWFFYKNYLRNVFIYFGLAAIVPLIYIAVIYYYLNQDVTFENALHFTLRDYFKGTADSNFSLKALIMIPISFIRSFIQVHPVILALIKSNWFFCLPLILFALILMYALKTKAFRIKKISSQYPGFHQGHIIILILHLLFAVYAKGNVEFMVMIPFLAAILMVNRIKFTPAFLMCTVLILFIWNFSYGIFPNHYYKMNHDERFLNYMIKNPEKIYVLKNYDTRSKYFYLTGKDDNENLLIFEKLRIHEVDSLIQKNKSIITDVIDYPEILNRQKIMNGHEDDFFHTYSKDLIFQFPGFYGETSVYEVRK